MGSDAAELMALCVVKKLCAGVGILRSCLKPDGGLATFGPGELRRLSRKSSGAAKDSSATYNSQPASATTNSRGYRLPSLACRSSRYMQDPSNTLVASYNRISQYDSPETRTSCYQVLACRSAFDASEGARRGPGLNIYIVFARPCRKT